jgi:flagellar P-ring protein precursor FlgI
MLCLAPALAARGGEIRIKDITDVCGVRVNQLTGMGLVVGLNGTGSSSPTTRRFAVNMLQRFGQRFDPTIRAQLETLTTQKTNNLSVVVVTADLPAFARAGARIDVMVSAFDDAKSLQGGTLIFTPLFGVDDEVYAIASGQVSTGGFSFSGEAANVQKNHPTSGRIPNGATIELETLSPIEDCGVVRLQLRTPDFETSRRIAEKIGATLQTPARSVDSTIVEIAVPEGHRQDVPGFLGVVGSLTVVPDVPARVVINERTGTVIIGQNVKLAGVLITHANLAVITGETPVVSQPAPFSDGETVEVPRTEINVTEEPARVNLVPETITVGDLAQALNSLGVSPRDLSSIFQQLKESGALFAELEFK